jgi:hypothetical protein
MFKTIASIIRSFCCIIKEACQDNATGKYSHARIIAILVAFGATVFMFQLAIAGSMSIEYFLGYLAYGTGYQGINKFLDNKDDSRYRRREDDTRYWNREDNAKYSYLDDDANY